MKKIMFNDKYGLTLAVLEGRKTQTRRIINGLPSNTKGIELIVSIISHREYDEQKRLLAVHTTDCLGKTLNIPYQVGEEIAIAQSYGTMANEGGDILANMLQDETTFKPEYCGAGWKNKMFVKADLMLHRIKITNVRVERLQDISDEDCFKEGVEHDCAEGAGLNWVDCEDRDASRELLNHKMDGREGSFYWETPQQAYASLIDHISGKGTWKSNPYVFVYDFELIK